MTMNCAICHEDIGALCLTCTSHDIKAFLPVKLRKPFGQFHASFSRTVTNGNGSVYCATCRSSSGSPMCPNCYTTEIKSWIGERNKAVAAKFSRTFSFQSEPLPEKRSREEESGGICDECGEYTEELVSESGEVVCSECAGDEE